MSPIELLEEKLSDLKLKRDTIPPKRIDALFAAATIALRAVCEAGAAGNVTCKIAAKQILKLLDAPLP